MKIKKVDQSDQKNAEVISSLLNRDVLHHLMLRTVFWGWKTIDASSKNLDAEVSGTGVLIQWDGGQGVLTAAHCLRPVEKGKEMVLIVKGKRSNLIALSIPIEVIQRSIIEYDPSKEIDGPDLAFVPLSKNMQTQMDRLSSVFHNIKRDWERQELRTNNQKQFGSFFMSGHVASDGEEATKLKRERIVMPRTVQISSVTKVEREDWDYLIIDPVTELDQEGGGYIIFLSDEIDEELNEITLRAPSSWKGMSGSGIWCLTQEGIERMQYDLKGIVFFEELRSESSDFVLHAHGPKSIRRIMNRVMESDINFQEPIARVYPLSMK